MPFLESALETQAASHKRTEEASAAAARQAQQHLSQLRDAERDLRLQLHASRNAHSTLSSDHEELRRKSEAERAAVTSAADASVRARGS